MILYGEPRWTKDKKTLTDVVSKDSNTPATYNVVETWYDGSFMDDDKLDEDLIYVKYQGKYLVKNFEYGQVLQKDTMEAMRNLSSKELLLLKMGVYKHIQLNGYYEDESTPFSINYFLSNSELTDDKGSLIVLDSGDKLEHTFSNLVNLSHFGLKRDQDFRDNHILVNFAINYSSRNGNIQIESPEGNYDFYGEVQVPISNTSIFGSDVATTWWYNSNSTFINIKNPLNSGLQSIKFRKIRLRDRSGNGQIALSLDKVRSSTFDDVEIWGSTSSFSGWKTAGLYIAGGELDGSWNNRFKNLKCNNMDGMAHLIRTSQNNAVYFLNASTENCGRSTGYMTWICGGNGVSFVDSHFENFDRAIRISPYDESFNLRSVSFINCYFEANENKPENRCLYITNKDKNGQSSRVINVNGLNISGGYWSGHGSDYGIEIDVVSGNVVTGSIDNVFYRSLKKSLLKSSTAGERIKITGRVYETIPLVEKTESSNVYVEEQSAGYDVIKNINRYNPEGFSSFYNIEKQYQFLRLTSSQVINSNSLKTVVSAQPSSAGSIILTLPLISTLALDNEITIFKGTDDSNTITINPSEGNQFNLPAPNSRNWNVLSKVNQYITLVKDTTAGWRIIDSGIFNRDKFLYNRNNPNGNVVAKSGTIYYQMNTSDVVVDVFMKVLTDNDAANWISVVNKKMISINGALSDLDDIKDKFNLLLSELKNKEYMSNI